MTRVGEQAETTTDGKAAWSATGPRSQRVEGQRDAGISWPPESRQRAACRDVARSGARPVPDRSRLEESRTLGLIQWPWDNRSRCAPGRRALRFGSHPVAWTVSPASLLSRSSGCWPAQMLVQKLKRPHAVDRVGAVEEFDGRAIADAERVVEPAHFGEFISDPFVRRDAVVVAAFNHERPRRDERGHFRVVERVAQIEFHHFIFSGVEIAVG